jgi:hypothetical protein
MRLAENAVNMTVRAMAIRADVRSAEADIHPIVRRS